MKFISGDELSTKKWHWPVSFYSDSVSFWTGQFILKMTRFLLNMTQLFWEWASFFKVTRFLLNMTQLFWEWASFFFKWLKKKIPGFSLRWRRKIVNFQSTLERNWVVLEFNMMKSVYLDIIHSFSILSIHLLIHFSKYVQCM